MSYDTAITVFSPNGQLLQVEYALEAARLGHCALGLLTAEHAVLAAERRVARRLQDAHTHRKVAVVDERLAAVCAGLGADARVVVNRARLEAQQFRLAYDDAPSADFVARRVSALMQRFTQTGGARPFGLSLLLAGADRRGPSLAQVDPSGLVTGFRAQALGRTQQKLNERLEKHFVEGMALEEGLRLAARCLADSVDNPRKNCEVVVVGVDGARFLTDAELERLFQAVEEEL